MELTQTQKEQLHSIWADLETRDLIEKGILAAIATNNVPITVGQALTVFAGITALSELEKEPQRSVNRAR